MYDGSLLNQRYGGWKNIQCILYPCNTVQKNQSSLCSEVKSTSKPCVLFILVHFLAFWMNSGSDCFILSQRSLSDDQCTPIKAALLLICDNLLQMQCSNWKNLDIIIKYMQLLTHYSVYRLNSYESYNNKNKRVSILCYFLLFYVVVNICVI